MTAKTMKKLWLRICLCTLGITSGALAAPASAELKSASSVSAQATAPIAPEILFFILKGDGVSEDGAEQPTDTDDDGVADTADQCANTPAGASVDSNGCADSQLDDDGDTVSNDLDQCPATPTDETADATGCSPSQLDTDNDGVTDDLDQCPNTSPGVAVDDQGCEDTSGSLKDDYIQNVHPLITDFQKGCTSSGCHGKGNAPGGLSLYGSNVAGSDQLNYDSLVSYIDRAALRACLVNCRAPLGTVAACVTARELQAIKLSRRGLRPSKRNCRWLCLSGFNTQLALQIDSTVSQQVALQAT